MTIKRSYTDIKKSKVIAMHRAISGLITVLEKLEILDAKTSNKTKRAINGPWVASYIYDKLS